MTLNRENLTFFQTLAKNAGASLIAVSKTKPSADILEAFEASQKIFGENYVQELVEKQRMLPGEIEWHFIGHLQTNKVKLIAPFISLIHTVDSLRLLREINAQGLKNNRIIGCLLQVYIATEETKFGFDMNEALSLLQSDELNTFNNVQIRGLMGMATNTTSKDVIEKEFRSLRNFYDGLKAGHQFNCLSMGMSSDYEIALREGSNMIRIGSAIFGDR